MPGRPVTHGRRRTYPLCASRRVPSAGQARRIVGWATSCSLETSLVTEALQQALVDRRPGAGLLHHSDRGCQYASSAYRALLGEVPRLEGVFIFRREILSRLPLKSEGRGWTVVWELIVRAHRAGLRIVLRRRMAAA